MINRNYLGAYRFKVGYIEFFRPYISKASRPEQIEVVIFLSFVLAICSVTWACNSHRMSIYLHIFNVLSQVS
jgi:hypothetical protein